jgi:hypothetical protein
MYRDLIEAPERVTVNGREFWYQQFNTLSGSLEAVRLYAEDGAFIAEFSDYPDMIRVMKELAKGETA